MIEHSLKEISVGVILWIFHVELIGRSNPCLHDLPERQEIRTAAEDKIEEVHCVDFGLLLLFLTQLLDTDFGHIGLCARMKGFLHVNLYFLSGTEELVDKLTLMVAV